MFKKGDELVIEGVLTYIYNDHVAWNQPCRFVRYLSEHEMRGSDADLKATGIDNVDPRNTCEVAIMDLEYDQVLYHLLVNPKKLSYRE